MNRADKLLAFKGIDIDLLRGSQRNKEIARLSVAIQIQVVEVISASALP